MSGGFVTDEPRLILRAEGFALLAVATAAYAFFGESWWLYAALILAPDLAMLGYLAGPGMGARLYNLAHTTVAPLILALAWLVAREPLLLAVALVWLAHIGLDRMLGYGLKYPTAFADTHLGRIGRAAPNGV